MSYDINCPYCDAELDICHDDGFGYEECVRHEMFCHKCENNFVFETSILFRYEPAKADCLNGKAHNVKLSNTAPKEFSTMCCTDCDFSRELTDDERKQYGIGTKQDYFESIKSTDNGK